MVSGWVATPGQLDRTRKARTVKAAALLDAQFVRVSFCALRGQSLIENIDPSFAHGWSTKTVDFLKARVQHEEGRSFNSAGLSPIPMHTDVADHNDFFLRLKCNTCCPAFASNSLLRARRLICYPDAVLGGCADAEPYCYQKLGSFSFCLSCSSCSGCLLLLKNRWRLFC